MKEIHRPLDLAELPIEEIENLLKMYSQAEMMTFAKVAINTIKKQQKILRMYKREKNDSQDKFEALRDDVFNIFEKYR